MRLSISCFPNSSRRFAFRNGRSRRGRRKQRFGQFLRLHRRTRRGSGWKFRYRRPAGRIRWRLIRRQEKRRNDLGAYRGRRGKFVRFFSSGRVFRRERRHTADPGVFQLRDRRRWRRRGRRGFAELLVQLQRRRRRPGHRLRHYGRIGRIRRRRGRERFHLRSERHGYPWRRKRNFRNAEYWRRRGRHLGRICRRFGNRRHQVPDTVESFSRRTSSLDAHGFFE